MQVKYRPNLHAMELNPRDMGLIFLCFKGLVEFIWEEREVEANGAFF